MFVRPQQASLSEWKDQQGPKQPDIPDAVKDSEGGTCLDYMMSVARSDC
jgi:hypothetical protein|eukprot:COSAG02_NODE_3619_length_6464_cov_15.210683_9_plen_49_part_00